MIIRLTRRGAKKRPFYRLVVADSRSPRDGRVIDTLGFYDPIGSKEPYRIDGLKTVHWLNEGVTMSDTVQSLLRRTGIIQAWRDGENGAGLGVYEAPVEPETPKPSKAAKKKAREATEKAAKDAATAKVAAATATEEAPAEEAVEAATEEAPAEEAVEAAAEEAPAEETTDDVADKSSAS